MAFRSFLSAWAAFNLLQVCTGFAVLTQQRPTMFSRDRFTLRYKEDDKNAAEMPMAKNTDRTLWNDKPFSFVEFDAATSAVAGAVAYSQKKQSLRPLNFEVDIKDFLDSDRPYYALENEHIIVDDETGEITGFICTGKVEIPAGRESDGVPFAEFLRHAGVAGSVAALLRNPRKMRHFYPASQYDVDVHPYKGKVMEMLAEISGGDHFYQTIKGNDPVIFTRCIDFSKKSAKIEFLLETDDGTGRVIFDCHILPERLFQKMYPSPPVLPESAKPKGGSPYGELGAMSNITRVWAFADECLTMEATLPPTKSVDCEGHFFNNPTLPHSIMVFHNCDLIGQALSEFTDVNLPFKQSDFGQDHGMKILSWTCLPETLHFPDTGGLKLQAKVFLSKGELGKPGSTYVTESVVKQAETGLVVYKASGTIILNPIKFLATEFRRAIANKDFEVLWEKLDINGDGVVSREELRQFVRSSGMTELDDKEFDILFGTIDTDHNGELSFEEVTEYFNSLHLGVKEDFGESVGKYLSGEFTKDGMAAIWSKLDINGDGVVSLEELDLFITSELTEFSRKDASFLHHAIDKNSDGVVSFSEFISFLDSVKPPAFSP